MPNRRASSVPLANEFNPKPSLAKDTGAMPFVGGEVDDQISGMLAGVAQKFGRYADRAAAVEGEAAGKVAGLDPGYRPSGRTGIFGRAYDQAATGTYVDQLETNIRERSWGAFNEWKQLPPDQQTTLALDQRLAKVGEDLGPDLKGFDTIRGEVGKRLSALQLGFRNHALETIDARTKAERQASLITSINTTETSASQAATIDPEGPTARLELQDLHRKIDDEVKAGALPPEEGARRKIETSRRVGVAVWRARADKATTPDQVKALHSRLDDEFKKDPTATGLDGAAIEVIRNELETRQNHLRAQGQVEANTLKTRLKGVVDRYADSGVEVPAGEMDALRQAAAAVPEGAGLLELTEKKIEIARAAKNRRPEELALEAGLLRQAFNMKGGGSSAEAELVSYREELAKKAAEARASDFLGYAQKTGRVTVVPIDPRRDRAGLVDDIRRRVATAHTAAEELHGPRVYWTKEEESALVDVANEGGDQALALATAIAEGAGKDAPRVLAGLQNRAPTIYQIGNLIAAGGPGALQTARDAAAAIKTRKDGGQLPELPQSFANLYNDDFGDALRSHGEAQQRIRSTAKDVWATRILREAVAPDSSRSEAIYREALQEAAGRSTVNGKVFGGVAKYTPPDAWFAQRGKVPVPPNVKPDKLGDLIGALKDSDFDQVSTGAGAERDYPVDEKGTRLGVKELRRAHLVYTSQGYRFALGDPAGTDPKYIRSSKSGPGRPVPFALNLTDFEAILRPRVPSAYLGGQ